jgi:hypothetical protein
MREVFTEIESWRKQGKSIAIATNVKKEGFFDLTRPRSPRPFEPYRSRPGC